MAERPIIFSAPMIRAILSGSKTMTRRLVTSPLAKCQPGDLLWVREAFTIIEARHVAKPGGGYEWREDEPMYAADYAGLNKPDRDWNWSPSIHMPRWASRITLRVTAVKIEQLQEISEEDALSEGVEPYAMTARGAFFALWNSLHGPGAWEK